MPPREIDWSAVREARRRSKCGRQRPGDQELCERAWKADPERYRTLSTEVVDEVTDKMRETGSA